MRCFVGIPLADPMAASLAEACEVIRREDPAWCDEKWVAIENYHVTLKFLGEIADESAGELLFALKTVAEGTRTFPLVLEGVRATPSARRSRMLWATFQDPTGGCAALATGVDDAAAAVGVEADTRPFSAHATLCRTRGPRRLDQRVLAVAADALSQAEITMSVPGISVFSSRLTPRGPIYSVIGSWRLRGE